MFKNKKNEKTKNINNDKIKEQKNVLMDEGEKKERKIMKRIALVCALVAVVGGSFYGGMSYGRLLPASHRYYSNSQVYATVGDTDITGKDIKSVMEPIFYSNGLQKLTDSQISTYESTMLEYLVNIEVLYKEAKESNVEVTDDQVNENYETTISNINSQYNLSEEEYFEKFNLTEEKLKQRIKKELMGAKYLEEYSNVSEDEARNYFEKNKNDYKQIRASHILISNYDSNNKEVSDDKKEENKKTAEEVLKLALDGEDFATLAKEYSDDSSASKGGDLGYFNTGEMEEAFETAAYKLNVNEYTTTPVETSYGYHIIMKTGQKDKPSYKKSKDSIKEKLVDEKKDNDSTISAKAMIALRKKYNIKIKDKTVKNDYNSYIKNATTTTTTTTASSNK